jgi:hypothetical protein
MRCSGQYEIGKAAQIRPVDYLYWAQDHPYLNAVGDGQGSRRRWRGGIARNMECRKLRSFAQPRRIGYNCPKLTRVLN